MAITKMFNEINTMTSVAIVTNVDIGVLSIFLSQAAKYS
jgi:hypothetical protein